MVTTEFELPTYGIVGYDVALLSEYSRKCMQILEKQTENSQHLACSVDNNTKGQCLIQQTTHNSNSCLHTMCVKLMMYYFSNELRITLACTVRRRCHEQFNCQSTAGELKKRLQFPQAGEANGVYSSGLRIRCAKFSSFLDLVVPQYARHHFKIEVIIFKQMKPAKQNRGKQPTVYR